VEWGPSGVEPLGQKEVWCQRRRHAKEEPSKFSVREKQSLGTLAGGRQNHCPKGKLAGQTINDARGLNLEGGDRLWGDGGTAGGKGHWELFTDE